MMEIWKDVEGYCGRYQVSSLGNVKSLSYRRLGYPKNLVPKKNNCGRLWVELTDGKTKKQFLVHRLVAEAFIKNELGLPEINHIDENPQNNVVWNLEWCTREYNIRYSIEKYRRPHKSKLSALKINQLTISGEFVRQWDNVNSIQKSTGMIGWPISECCRRNRKTAYGFKWQYAV